MNKDFVEVANDSGTNNGSFDVVCGRNSGDKRSTVLIVSGGGINKTMSIVQKSSNPGVIEIAGPLYYSDGTLATIRWFGLRTDIGVSMASPQMGRFIFPTPIQEMDLIGVNSGSFFHIAVNTGIPTHYKGEKVVAFLESPNGNRIYTPKKELTADVYTLAGKNVFELNIDGGVNVGNTEIININFALNNRPNIVILLTNNKQVQLVNLIWKAIYA